ncbi:DMT family transporter [Marinovum sp. 2_MG-2023]|uniref:DMT family transporter n=1 Tax=unclassified Marinovum TaxID=2647166 RepID=UPI0026E3B0D7|nr:MULTISPECIES: DMT family transporter [unclassified Marinovum]MDO6729474.1 DMT family transporter [Marinovum sp. 2_MG-2023]MDO6780373.1 DMT family transporter [Marinovum sp. 1_MG-2023]
MSQHRGPLLMIAAMALFALEDMFLKAAMVQVSVGFALMVFGAGGMVVFLVWAALRGERLWHPAIFTPPLMLRSVSEVAGRVFYTVAIAFAPLSLVSAILQATPLVVAIGAVVFFGETVGWRRWLAICIGFVGVLMILRPGTDAFEVTSVLAVLGMLGFAGRDLATRASPPSMSNVQIGVYGFLMLVIAGGLLTAFQGVGPLPDLHGTAALLAAILIGVLAYTCLTGSMRIGTVSITVPFRYTRLIFAMILGITVFGERPDLMTWCGAAVIVLSGLYTLFRSEKAAA